MKYKWILAVAILWLGNIKSQSCDGFNKNTFQHTTSSWDWRDGSDANSQLFSL